MPSARGSWSAVLVALLSSACGAGAGAAGREPSSAPAREPLTELDALQRDFDTSEARLTAQLERQLAAPGTAQEKKADAGPPAEAAPAPASAPKAATAGPRDKDRAGDETTASEAQAEGTVGSACDLVCRALGSMRRSADGICSLTGEPHQRCSSARGRVERAARQVAGAGCQCRP
jgi:hypothetical protein